MSRRTSYFLFISFVALAAFVMVGLASARAQDWPFDPTRPFKDVRNLSGPLGSLLAYGLVSAFGKLFAWVIPFLVITLGAGIVAERTWMAVKISVKSILILVLMTSFFALMRFTSASDRLSGSIGHAVAGMVSSVLGEFGGTIVLITLLLLVLLTQLRWAATALGGVMDDAPAGGERIAAWATSTSGWVRDRVLAFREAQALRREARRAAKAERRVVLSPEPPEKKSLRDDDR